MGDLEFENRIKSDAGIGSVSTGRARRRCGSSSREPRRAGAGVLPAAQRSEDAAIDEWAPDVPRDDDGSAPPPSRPACSAPGPSRAQRPGSSTTIRWRGSQRRRTRRRSRRGNRSRDRSALNLFSRPGDPTPDVRAQNVNTIDEVPDSSWFTNRIGARPMSVDGAVRGPLESTGRRPARWTVIRAKTAGPPRVHGPGRGRRDLVLSVRPADNPEAATGAVVVANKLFWALGYYQVENHLTTLRSTSSHRPEGARHDAVRRPRPLRQATTSTRSSTGASGTPTAPTGWSPAALLPGTGARRLPLLRHASRRPERRRPARAPARAARAQVFGAWTNLTDMKAGNTLDTLITENGRGVVRHYLQDVGSTFGIGANGRTTPTRATSTSTKGARAEAAAHLGFYLRPWQTMPLRREPAIGRFQGDAFDPNVEAADADGAFLRRARRRHVLGGAAGDGVHRRHDPRGRQDGQYGDPARREAPRRRAHPAPRQDRPRVPARRSTRSSSSGWPTAADVRQRGGCGGLRAGPGRPTRRRGRASTTPPARRRRSPRRRAAAKALPAPPGLPADGYVKVDVKAARHANEAWTRPVSVYFRRDGGAWTLVGVERLP